MLAALRQSSPGHTHLGLPRQGHSRQQPGMLGFRTYFSCPRLKILDLYLSANSFILGLAKQTPAAVNYSDPLLN